MTKHQAAHLFVDAKTELENLRSEELDLDNRRNKEQARLEEARKVLADSVGQNITEKAWTVGNRIVYARFQGGVSVVTPETES